MRITASSFYGLYWPSGCSLRVFLRSKDTPEGKPNPYQEILKDLGVRYEVEHVGTLSGVTDLTPGAESERVEGTIRAIQQRAQVIYHPFFRVEARISGIDVTLVGEPDLLIWGEGGYVVRDVKLTRRITEKDHPEILFQLGMYGWLFEEATGGKPARLEVLAGTRRLEVVPLSFCERAKDEVQRIVEILQLQEAPYSPVGWTKCGACTFCPHCWPSALKRRDVAIVPGVDQSLATVLHDNGIDTIDALLGKYDVAALSDVKKPWGKSTQKVGKAAEKILRLANAIALSQEELLQPPEIPFSENYVMFDLEGLPPQLDELDKIYLWGLQVFGTNPSDYVGKIAATGANGDLAGWEGFLESARTTFGVYGDIPFVHWHHYERTKIDQYIERFGDRDGIAERVKTNLLDLLPRTQKAVALPLPSYSLKVVEEYVGFHRSQEEYGGHWAMATFIKATETNDEATRKSLLDSVLEYNREDLAATWEVLKWLRKKIPATPVAAGKT